MKEKGSNKRRPIAGLMLMLLYLSKKAKALTAAGAALIVIGFIGAFYFGSIVVNQASQYCIQISCILGDMSKQ